MRVSQGNNSQLYMHKIPFSYVYYSYFKDESGGKFDFQKSISLAPKLYALSSEPIVMGKSVPKAENIYRAKGVMKTWALKCTCTNYCFIRLTGP